MRLRSVTEFEFVSVAGARRPFLRWYAAPSLVHQEVMLLATRATVWNLRLESELRNEDELRKAKEAT